MSGQQNGGNPDESTAVTKRPQRKPVAFAVFMAMILAATLVLLAVTCQGKVSRDNSAATVKAQTAQTGADITMLQVRILQVEKRTGVLEADAVTDRQSAAGLLSEIKKLQASKADLSDLKTKADLVDLDDAKKANRRDLRKYAQNVRQRVEAVEQEVAAIRAAPVSTQLGTIVVVPRLEPVYFGEE